MKNWTEEEIAILRENYNSVSNYELRMLIPNKTGQAIYKKAYKMGMRKSPEIEFLNRSNANKGENCNFWKGGVKKNKNGYRMILLPDHHRSDTGGYVLEHILVWEEKSGMRLPDNCCIHHLNGVKDDNRIENLCVMLKGAHSTFHNIGTTKSAKTREIISSKAKIRLSDKRNHPCYKHIDREHFCERIKAGASVREICEEFGIGKTTYYSKRREFYSA